MIKPKKRLQIQIPISDEDYWEFKQMILDKRISQQQWLRQVVQEKLKQRRRRKK